MLRIPNSILDAYEFFKQSDWMTTEKLFAQIKGEDDFSPLAKLGTAFHDIIGSRERMNSDGDIYQVYWFGDTFLFERYSADKALEGFWGGVDEVRVEPVFMTRHGQVRVICKADYLIGRKGMELKTSTKPFQADKVMGYANSLQWKLYSMALDLNVFEYRLVQLDVPTEKQAEGGSKLDRMIYCVGDEDEDYRRGFTVYPYRGMEAEVRAKLEEYVDFCIYHGLREYLDEDAFYERLEAKKLEERQRREQRKAA